MTSTKPSVAFTVPKVSELSKIASPIQMQGVTQRGKIIRLNNRAVPLNPRTPLNDPRAGNFGTKRLRGF